MITLSSDTNLFILYFNYNNCLLYLTEITSNIDVMAYVNNCNKSIY